MWIVGKESGGVVPGGKAAPVLKYFYGGVFENKKILQT